MVNLRFNTPAQFYESSVLDIIGIFNPALSHNPLILFTVQSQRSALKKILVCKTTKQFFSASNSLLVKTIGTPLPSVFPAQELWQKFSDFFTNKIVLIRLALLLFYLHLCQIPFIMDLNYVVWNQLVNSLLRKFDSRHVNSILFHPLCLISCYHI